MPYHGSNGGVVQAKLDEEAKLALIDSFYAEARDDGACSATIITNPLEEDGDFYETHAAHNYRDERIGLITHLPESKSVEDIFAMLSSPRPRNIRRAIKEGVDVTISNDEEALKFVHETHKENMLAIGGISKEWMFFNSIKNTMPDGSWNVFMAHLKGEPIAALLLFYFNRTVEYFTPVIQASQRATQALPLLIFEAMKNAMERGYSNWNWGGTWVSQKGVYEFKKRWGAHEYIYYYYTNVFEKDILYQKRGFFMKEYPGFYIVPFNELKDPEDE